MRFTYDRLAVAHTTQHSPTHLTLRCVPAATLQASAIQQDANPGFCECKDATHIESWHGVSLVGLGFSRVGPQPCSAAVSPASQPTHEAIDCGQLRDEACRFMQAHLSNGSCLPTPTGGEQHPGADPVGETSSVRLEQGGNKPKLAKHSRC
jgi:hypothetical protein